MPLADSTMLAFTVMLCNKEGKEYLCFLLQIFDYQLIPPLKVLDSLRKRYSHKKNILSMEIIWNSWQFSGLGIIYSGPKIAN